MAKKNLIIDTNVFLSDSECFDKFENNDLFIPIKVLEELDKHKTRQDSVGFHARQTIKRFDALRASGSLSKGVRLGKGVGLLRFIKAEELAMEELPQGLSHKSSDNLILAAALAIKAENPKRKCIVVSQDVNMRVIADALGSIKDLLSSWLMTLWLKSSMTNRTCGFTKKMQLNKGSFFIQTSMLCWSRLKMKRKQP